MIRVLFVCLGNICRSPTAEGVFRAKVAAAGLAEHVEIDSAGTAAWHIGKSPDSRTRAAAKQRGFDLESLRARQVQPSDFAQFDWVLAMDRSNLADLQKLRQFAGGTQPQLFLPLADLSESEVPDPYYGGADGFEQVLDLIEAASDALLQRVREQL